MLTITLVSLVVALAAGFVAWRSLRREQLRATARISVLAAAIDDAPAFDSPFRDEAIDWPEESASSSVLLSVPTLGTIAHPSLQRRLLTAGIGLAVVLAIVVLIAMSGGRHTPPAARAAAPHVKSLELLSVRAAREGATLAVTGLVRNPANEPLNAVTAVVTAVDAQGRPVGDGRTALAALSPGQESQFVVTIGDVGGVARYRVSFRGATGVIRHVDRRIDRTGNES